MSYRIKLTRPLAKERRRIALEQIEDAISGLGADVLDTREYIHQVRVRMKKIRALLRLYRTADNDWYQRENEWFRNLAQEFAGPRDADVAVQTCHALLDRCKDNLDGLDFEGILSNLVQARSREFDSDASTSDLDHLRELLDESRSRIIEWPVKKLKTSTIVNGFGMTYARGRKALKRCMRDSQPEAWHEWRKRVKYQRYQWELLQGLWPEIIDPRRHELHRLSDFLGENHDLSEFVRHIEDMDSEYTRAKECLIALARQRDHDVRHAALPLGRKLFADREKCAKARLEKWFRIAINH